VKGLLSAGAISVAGAVGKSVYDGPEFKENVDLTGKTIVITGANTGLGKEAAVRLAGLGKPEIIMLCRNKDKATKSISDIVQKSGNKNVHFIECDLADLTSISKCAEELKNRVSKVDVLQLNSGVMAIPTRETTVDGFEKHLGINHLGHFKLTQLIFPLLEKTQGARVVAVSSTAHLIGNLDRGDLQLSKSGAYDPWRAYGNSKLANILFSKELNRRLQSSGNPTGVVSVSLHPGVCRTELGRYLFDPTSIPEYLYPVLGVVASPLLYFTKDAYMGAQTQIFLSATKSLSVKNGGEYYDNSRVAQTSPESNDNEEAKWLWEESEKLTSCKFL